MPPPSPTSLLDRVGAKSVYVCAGPGGVGKTTTAAALALGLARRGEKVAVVTIDPARRLASALGLRELENDPLPISAELLAAHHVELAPGGELWAMMLDPKSTFDELVMRLSPDEGARREIFENRIYQELSSAIAGSQEFTAMAKLYQLREDADFDVIVLDTPPSRNALDFLDAPTRLTRFLDGRALKLFLSPGGLAARFVGRGTGLVFAVFARMTGVDLLSDVSSFFGSLGAVTEGFGERARAVEALLHDSQTTFLLVTSPEPEPTREAIFFAQRLADAGMARGAVIVNRVHTVGLDGHSTESVEGLLGEHLDERLAARVASNLADFDVLRRRDEASIAKLAEVLGEPSPILVPQLDGDVYDLEGLTAIEGHLFGAQPGSPAS